ncbi:hypothetical protein L873DRAFT_1786147 [Choiromyces venosus 120613-1]|uniref:Uncharacterized protein n=1 Tax=Choiromyces venosus 120613-1 TaxID=1336337 RepID=A0A3N4KFK4_9PEZI|nr:hypothetical protein L873DRAFT_1786147 [Choiromyces venosus 120613-1]
MKENNKEGEEEEEKEEVEGKGREIGEKGNMKSVSETLKKERIRVRKEARNIEKDGRGYEEEKGAENDKDLLYISQYTIISNWEDKGIRIEGESSTRVSGLGGQRQRRIEKDQGKTRLREAAE